MKFDLEKIKENKNKVYEVIQSSHNLYIFFYKNKRYAYSYATCMFYELEFNDKLLCYYVTNRLNHYRLAEFKVWQFTKNPKTGWLEHSFQVDRGVVKL